MYFDACSKGVSVCCLLNMVSILSIWFTDHDVICLAVHYGWLNPGMLTHHGTTWCVLKLIHCSKSLFSALLMKTSSCMSVVFKGFFLQFTVLPFSLKSAC